MGKYIWMKEWGLVVRIVKGCRHLPECYLLLSSCTNQVQRWVLSWVGSGGKNNKKSSRSSFFHVALPSCLLSSFAMPLLAVMLLFVWPGCKQG